MNIFLKHLCQNGLISDVLELLQLAGEHGPGASLSNSTVSDFKFWELDIGHYIYNTDIRKC